MLRLEAVFSDRNVFPRRRKEARVWAVLSELGEAWGFSHEAVRQ